MRRTTSEGVAVKILVTAKRVEDPESKIKVKPDGSGIVHRGAELQDQPLRRDRRRGGAAPGRQAQGRGGGGLHRRDKVVQEQLRHALAMGADRGVWVKHEGPLDPMASRRLLKKVVEKEKPDLVILGKQTIDDDQNQVGQFLAEFLGWRPGHLRLQDRVAGVRRGEEQGPGARGERGRQERAGGARGGRRAGDPRVHPAGGGHRRPAPQPAALRVAAGHHEGQEASPSRSSPPPRSAWT